jgi:hypothetical protein
MDKVRHNHIHTNDEYWWRYCFFGGVSTTAVILVLGNTMGFSGDEKSWFDELVKLLLHAHIGHHGEAVYGVDCQKRSSVLFTTDLDIFLGGFSLDVGAGMSILSV